MKILFLIVYYDYNLKYIEKVINHNETNFTIVICTYNVELYDMYNSRFDVLLIEEEEITIFDVSQEVIKMCENINKSILKYIDKDKILHYQKHVEGGYTSGRIQDLLILEKLINKIFDKYQVYKVVDFIDDDFNLESSLIKTYCGSCSIGYKKQYKFSISSLKKYIVHHVKPYLSELYKFYRFMKFNIVFKKKEKLHKDNFFIFSLNSNSNKFIDLYSSLFNKFDQVNQKYCFITHTVNKNADNIKHIKDKVYLLEHYENISDYIISIAKTLNFLYKLKKNKNKIKNDLNLQERIINKEIYQSLYCHVLIDTGYRYRYTKSMHRFLVENNKNISAFKLWGEVSLIEGEIAHKLIKMHFSKIKTIGFEVGIGLKTFPYVPNNIKNIDYIITAHDLETELYLSYGVNSNKILQLHNFKNNGTISKFKDLYTVSDSFHALNINDNYDNYILIDISVAYRGYQSNINIFELINFIPILANQYKNYLFLIKPHPGFKSVDYLHDKLNATNIIIFDKSISILHLLNISHVVITKYSAIGVEGILFDKLIISILKKGHNKFKAYDEAAIYLNKKEDIHSILDNIQWFESDMGERISNYKEKIISQNNSLTVIDILKKLKEG